jgi:hypothetical protein
MPPPGAATPSVDSAPAPRADAGAADTDQSTTSTLPPDAAPPAGMRVPCPSEQSSLRLCLRFEDNLRDESAAGLSIASEQVGFEGGAPGGGRAIRLGGESSIRVQESGALDLQTMTTEAWIKLDRLPTGMGRVAVIDKDARYGMFVLPNGALVCSARGGVATTGGGVVAAGQWVAVACTASGDSVQAWVAGSQRAEGNIGPAAPGNPMPGLAIGSNMPSGDLLIGSIDNLRIWNRELSSDEICDAALGCS